MKKALYLVFAIFGMIGIVGLPYSYASDNPVDLMSEVVYDGACTSLEDDVGIGLTVSPILLTDCSLTMIWPGMINQILMDNEIIDKRIF